MIIELTDLEFEVVTIGVAMLSKVYHEDASYEIRNQSDNLVFLDTMHNLNRAMPDCIPLHELLYKLQNIRQVNANLSSSMDL